MDDKKFKEMDQSLMKKTEALREQKISEGMLKGFSTSVERRISGSAESERKPAGRLVWVPALAVMVLASVAVLRSPVTSDQEIQLAQAVTQTDDVQEEIAVLSELGVLDEVEDADLLSDEDALLDGDTELTQKLENISVLA